MGRIRTVKPELFTHEDLYELEVETGLPIRFAFAGLFTCCDREGLFKWKPKTLKLSVLPYDEIDFSRVLDALESRGLIRKYEIERVEYGVIPTFLKHQVINNREAASDLPLPTESSYISNTSTRDPRVNDASQQDFVSVDHAPLGEGKGKEGKGIGKEGKEISVEQNQLDVVTQIFAYWQKTMSSPKSVLDTNRKGLITKALKNYSATEICKAIRGCSKSPHNMGQNDQKTKYNGLGLILRNAEKIDRFIQLDDNQAVSASESLEDRNARIVAEVMQDVRDTDDNTIEMEV